MRRFRVHISPWSTVWRHRDVIVTPSSSSNETNLVGRKSFDEAAAWYICTVRPTNNACCSNYTGTAAAAAALSELSKWSHQRRACLQYAHVRRLMGSSIESVYSPKGWRCFSPCGLPFYMVCGKRQRWEEEDLGSNCNRLKRCVSHRLIRHSIPYHRLYDYRHRINWNLRAPSCMHVRKLFLCTDKRCDRSAFHTL